MLIIFDLDQTLIDTSSVEGLRSAGKWPQVMARVNTLKVYDGITVLLSNLHDAGHIIAIVTRSPDMVARAIVKHNGWPIEIIIGYHQVKVRKPSPEGLLLAMKNAGAKAQDTFHIGDQPDDTAASRAAGVTALGAAWGIANTDALKASLPDQMFSSVEELADFFRKAFSQAG